MPAHCWTRVSLFLEFGSFHDTLLSGAQQLYTGNIPR
jgi:hypothetical protein